MTETPTPSSADPIPIGARVPRRPAHRWVRGLLHAAGWQYEGTVPDAPKFVLIGGPHTSNWDFLLAMAVVFGLGLDFHWIGKHTLFRGPFGPLMRWAGGIPVNRERPGRLVQDTIQAFQARDRFVVGLSPEGTRRKVDTWKTGFHRIATGADVPILPAWIDAQRKRIGFDPLFWPTDDREADIAYLMGRYRRFSR
jgi:1-acyl-sn-glycerol-3-phosphate acyltransferase